jgi:hypothetical protein
MKEAKGTSGSYDLAALPNLVPFLFQNTNHRTKTITMKRMGGIYAPI